jgi:transcriptional regulator with AAA-type ATPase domain
VELHRRVERYRRFRQVPVLLLGAPGVGKSVLARGLHTGPGRLVSVNCAQLGGELLAAELFGTVAGAFSGAVTRRGKVAEAHEGTLFLDEAGELSDRHQAQLTTFLDTGEYLRVGEDAPKRSTARVILATWREPATWMRPDLQDRLGHHVVRIPPPTRADLCAALEDWLRALPAQHGTPRLPLANAARSELLARAGSSYRGPRTRLEVAYMDAVLEGASAVELRHLPPAEAPDVGQQAAAAWVDTCLGAAQGDVQRAAVLAGVSRATMYRRIRRAGRHLR